MLNDRLPVKSVTESELGMLSVPLHDEQNRMLATRKKLKNSTLDSIFLCVQNQKTKKIFKLTKYHPAKDASIIFMTARTARNALQMLGDVRLELKHQVQDPGLLQIISSIGDCPEGISRGIEVEIPPRTGREADRMMAPDGTSDHGMISGKPGPKRSSPGRRRGTG